MIATPCDQSIVCANAAPQYLDLATAPNSSILDFGNLVQFQVGGASETIGYGLGDHDTCGPSTLSIVPITAGVLGSTVTIVSSNLDTVML